LGIMNAGSWVARRRPISVEPIKARHASGPRFERFAAAMQAMPPPSAQVLPEADATPAASRPAPGPIAAVPATAAPPPAEPKPAHLRPAAWVQADEQPASVQADEQPATAAQAFAETADAATVPPMPDAGSAATTVIPRRPVIEDAGRSRADVPWLGIASWLLLCGALFASLVWPGTLDRIAGYWPSELTPSAILARWSPQGEPTPEQAAPSPAPEQQSSPTPPSAVQEPMALPPVELAPPIQSDAPSDTAGPGVGGPPLPRFKPSVDRVAAKFSNAFFEIGDHLQQQGEFEAAVHMRRQGTNLNPWKAPSASNL
jgi:hypothetical protein